MLRRALLVLSVAPALLIPCPVLGDAIDEVLALTARRDLPPSAILNSALSKLQPLADKGDPVAQYYLGDILVRYATEPHKPTGVIWLQLAAKAGVPDAMNTLANVLSDGKIITKDEIKATELFMQAASLGFLPAYNNLGLRSARGIGRAPDMFDASEWFRLAAEQGFAESQQNLAILFFNGEGLKQDLVEAYKWMALAQRAGDRDAVQQLPVIAQRMTPGQIQEAEKRVAEWKPTVKKR